MTIDDLSFTPPAGAVRFARVLAVCGLAAAAFGLASNADRLWASWLLAGWYLVGLGLGGLFFVALQYVTGAEWSIAFRRVPEAMAATLSAGAALVAVALVAHPSLYPWTHEAIAADAGPFRQLWLTWPFFLARAAGYLAVWTAFSFLILRTSRRQDDEGGDACTRTNARLSAGFLVIFGITFSLASFDWIMSREPDWSSTIFAAYNFAGLFLSGIAAVIVIAVWLGGNGPLRHVLRDEHLHDLGKLLFAFSTFWMYIWFSQYMLIWYADVPEEAAYFAARTQHAWQPLFYLNVLLNWVVPFVILLRRDTKRRRTTIARVAIVVLIGRWLDLYQMIFPPLTGAVPRIGIIEAGVTAGAAGLFLLALFRALRRAPVVPIGDPLLLESLHYHV